MSATAPVTSDIRPAYRPTRIEVSLGAIERNVAHLRHITGTEVCAVVKGDGYGHGSVPVARAALAGGATWLAVALVEEGLVLREAGIDGPILVLAEPPVAALRPLLEADLTPMAYRDEFLATADALGRERGRPVPVHLKLDTGMGRVGAPADEWRARLSQVADAPGLELQALATHLARADEPDVATTADQLAAFGRALAAAADLGLEPRWVHAANTAGALVFPASRYSLVRPGIGIYGLSPGTEVGAADHGLEPALRLVTEVAYAKRVAAGTPVSYGHRWTAPHDGWVATLPIGYADGVPRALTNQADVLIGGRRRPVAGTVCMDQVMAWCGDDEPAVGDEVVLLGEQGGERVLVEEWADAAETITYEIVTQLTARIPRHHVG